MPHRGLVFLRHARSLVLALARWRRERRGSRTLLLALGLWFVVSAGETLPEPCPAVYRVWRWSLKQGKRGVWVREVIQPSLCVCDASLSAQLETMR